MISLGLAQNSCLISPPQLRNDLLIIVKLLKPSKLLLVLQYFQILILYGDVYADHVVCFGDKGIRLYETLCQGCPELNLGYHKP